MVEEELSPSLANLSSDQVQVVFALSHGASICGAANVAGVHRSTIYNWLTQPDFAKAVDEARIEYACELRDEFRNLSRTALVTVRMMLEGRNTSDAILARLALAILNHPEFAMNGWKSLGMELPSRPEETPSKS